MRQQRIRKTPRRRRRRHDSPPPTLVPLRRTTRASDTSDAEDVLLRIDDLLEVA